jgi:hypothetical protein
MARIPEAEQNRAREMMEVRVLMQILFVRAEPAPDRISSHVDSSSVRPEVADIFTRLHLAVRWERLGVAFDGIDTRPSTSIEGALTVRMRGEGWNGVVLRQLRDGLHAIDCSDISGCDSDDEAEQLIFTLPVEVVQRLRGADKV